MGHLTQEKTHGMNGSRTVFTSLFHMLASSEKLTAGQRGSWSSSNFPRLHQICHWDSPCTAEDDKGPQRKHTAVSSPVRFKCQFPWDMMKALVKQYIYFFNTVFDLQVLLVDLQFWLFIKHNFFVVICLYFIELGYFFHLNKRSMNKILYINKYWYS